MANDTTSIKLVGDRVWVKLQEMADHTTTETGVLVPLNEITETDGGRVTTKPSSKKHLLRGTVMQIADYAAAKLKDLMADIEVGDEIYISKNATHSGYEFDPKRVALVTDFSGDICIPHTLIEAKITKDEL